MKKRLIDFSTLTFDCYGTLIDWERGIWTALHPLLQANSCDSVTRQAALETFGAIEHRIEAVAPALPYPEILAKVHAGLAERLDLSTNSDLDRQFAASLPDWPVFPDTVEALQELKKHFRLVILSNVNRAGFAASSQKLGVEFDAVFTAEDIGSYKPNRRNFEYLLQHAGAPRGEILHTAQSLYHDHVPAKAVGLATAWIDRQGLSKGGSWGATAKVKKMPKVDFVFPSMAAMAEAIESR